MSSERERGPILHGLASVLGGIKGIDDLAEVRENQPVRRTLWHLGIRNYAESHLTVTELARQSCAETLRQTELKGSDIGAFIFATTTLCREQNYRRGLRELQAALGLSRCVPIGVFGSECSNLMTALQLAQDALRSRKIEHVLVVTADRAESGSRVMNGLASVLSDGAASAILSRSGDSGFELEEVFLHSAPDLDYDAQSGDGFAYLKAMMAGVVTPFRSCLQARDLQPWQLAKVITGNYNLSVLRTYGVALEIGGRLVFDGNVSRFAHCCAADTLINLVDCANQSLFHPNDRCVLLGSGANTWGAALVRAV